MWKLKIYLKLTIKPAKVKATLVHFFFNYKCAFIKHKPNKWRPINYFYFPCMKKCFTCHKDGFIKYLFPLEFLMQFCLAWGWLMYKGWFSRSSLFQFSLLVIISLYYLIFSAHLTVEPSQQLSNVQCKHRIISHDVNCPYNYWKSRKRNLSLTNT